jgi:hypothetical protein
MFGNTRCGGIVALGNQIKGETTADLQRQPSFYLKTWQLFFQTRTYTVILTFRSKKSSSFCPKFAKLPANLGNAQGL